MASPKSDALDHGANLDLAGAGHRVGAALHPLQRLGHVADLPQPEASDQLARRRERSVDNGPPRAVERHALAVGGWLEALAGHENPGIDELLVEPAHRLEKLGGRHDARLAVRCRLDQHHHAHRRVSSDCTGRS